MGFSYYVRMTSYIEIPRTAVPGANGNDKPLYLILRERGLKCYPGVAGDYADGKINNGIEYDDSGMPMVDLQRIDQAWDDNEYPKWADHEQFNKDQAIILETEVQESYKGRSMSNTGNYNSMFDELRDYKIDITNVECGWLYSFYNDMQI